MIKHHAVREGDAPSWAVSETQLERTADTPPSKQLKDVMHANKMEVDDLRDWLKKRAAGAK